MATTTPEAAAPQSSASAKDSSLLMTFLPYIIAIGAQIPLVILYFRTLWVRPHYSWFPFAFIAAAALAWMRWPEESKKVFVNSLFSNILLVMGLIFGLGGAFLIEPWLAAGSVMLLTASLFARISDKFGGTIWPAAMPLFVALVLPFNLDTNVITWLQRISANFTSRMLDVIRFGHYMPGTVIEVPGKEGGYGIEGMCSGIQSFFTLLFVTVVFIVWMRRPFFRSLLLVISAVFWAIFMNVVRLFVIPTLDFYAEIDLAHGIQHALLGWGTLLLGIILLLSTDQLLIFLFGPVDATSSQTGPMGKFITKVWNNLIAGDKEEDEHKKKRRRRPPLTAMSRTLAWVAAGFMVLAGGMSMVSIAKAFNAPVKDMSIQFFNVDVRVPLAKEDLPETIDNWELAPNEHGYRAEDRDHWSDFGRRSDAWTYLTPKYRAIVSLDQTFPGWHELSICYRSSGWKQLSRTWKAEEVDIDGKTEEWPFIEYRFKKPTGEHALVIFSLFDNFGLPYPAPKDWGSFTEHLNDLKNRFGQETRARLFRSETYQSQVYVHNFGEISNEVREEITDRYLKARKKLREAFLERRVEKE